MVYWVILRPEDAPDGQSGTGPALPSTVERLGPFENRERARSVGAARAEREGRDRRPSAPVRLEIVCDYA